MHEGHTQIAAARYELGRIVSRLKPGTRLPSYQALKKQLGVNRHALDIVYDEFAQDGVLERRPRSGIYLLNPFKGACFLFVAGADSFLTEKTGAPVRQNIRELNALIDRYFPGSFLELLLLRPGCTQPDEETLFHFRMLRRNLRVLGVFSSRPIASRPVRAAFKEWSWPCVDINNGTAPLSIMIQDAAIWRAALRHLKEEGWRDIVAVQWESENDEPADQDEDWNQIRSVRLPRPGKSGDWVAEGERYIQSLLKSNALPDAFIVKDDYLCRGMLQGALKKRVYLEDRCAIVTLFNNNVPIPCSRDLTRIEHRWDEIADAQMRLMQAAIRGDKRPSSPTNIQPTFVIGNTSRRCDY